MLMAERKRPGPRVNPDSKRSAGVDRHRNPRKAFHAPEELFDALDHYIAETRPQPSESAVLRLALEQFLRSVGYWNPENQSA